MNKNLLKKSSSNSTFLHCAGVQPQRWLRKASRRLQSYPASGLDRAETPTAENLALSDTTRDMFWDIDEEMGLWVKWKIDYNCGWSFYVSCYKWLHLYVLLPLNDLLFDIWNLVSNCEYYEKPLFYSALILKTTLLLNLSTRQLVKVKKKVKYSIFNALFSDLQFKVFKSERMFSLWMWK